MGLFFFWYKRSRDAKDNFLVTISQLSSELERTEEVVEFYDSTLLRTEEAVFRLHPFLHKSRRGDLSAVWNVYRQARAALQEAASDKRIDHIFDEYRRKHGWPIPKTKRERIEIFHKKFKQIAT